MKIKAPPNRELDTFRALYENQAAWDAGHDRPHRIVGIGTGGGMCCTRVAAIVEALADFGITHAFTSFVTVSGAGGPVGGYLSGIARQTSRVFEYLASAGFITWDAWQQIYVLNLSLFERALVGELAPFAFDQVRIQQHPTDFFVTTTLADGSKKLLNAKCVQPHAARAVCASSAFPGTCAPVIIDGVKHYDGAVGGNPLPIDEAVELLQQGSGGKPKIIVMQSRIHPKYRQGEWTAWPFYAHIKYALYSSRFRNNTARVDSCFATDAERLSAMRDVDWSRIVPTPDDVPLLPYTTDIRLLRVAREETLRLMKRVLTEARPVRQV